MMQQCRQAFVVGIVQDGRRRQQTLVRMEEPDEGFQAAQGQEYLVRAVGRLRDFFRMSIFG